MTPKERFAEASYRAKFVKVNWTAPTGIGLFNASYNVDACEMDVTFKVFVEFAETQMVKWTDEEKIKWKEQAFSTISTFWSNRFIFQCTKKGWEDISASVNVNLVSTPLAQAHLHLKVDKLPDDWPTSGGGVGWQTPPICALDNKALYPKDQRKIREGIFNLRVYQLEQGLIDRGVGFIPFDKNSGTLSPEAKGKLLDYARFVHRISTSDVKGIQLVVYGHTGGTDGHFNVGLGKKRANEVANVLKCVLRNEDVSLEVTDSPTRKKGLKAKIQETIASHGGKNTSSTSIQGVCIVVRVPKDVDHAAEMNYIVLCHEFGHMLGLPDEYMGRMHPHLTDRANADSLISKTLQLAAKQGDPATWDSSDQRKRGQQAGMSDLLDQNPAVRAPTFLSAGELIGNSAVGSASIMYGGMEVMPAHYLTLWACLVEMTSSHIGPAEWKIVPSPHNRTAIRYFR
ncbi:hypothetical protein [Panacagrimonas sp.]|uniref:hypothetical protein n=1 Tax=Panacagrimonas sp. TaxID=2480088 RepID=UPI003B52DD76